jgi:hypothetical protein
MNLKIVPHKPHFSKSSKFVTSAYGDMDIGKPFCRTDESVSASSRNPFLHAHHSIAVSFKNAYSLKIILVDRRNPPR